MKKPPICHRCGNAMKPVVYGLPSREDFENDSIILGGCIMTGDDPQWACDCENESEDSLV